MSLKDILRQVGLTETESKVYLALLEEGESLAGKIGDKADIHRKNVYDALSNLIKKGLVSMVIKSGKKHYSALSPERIKLILKEKQKRINKVMPELLKKFSNKKPTRNVTYFDGAEGIKTFLQDILNENKKLKVIGGTGKGYSKMDYSIFPWFKKINSQTLQLDVLFNYDSINRDKIINEVKNISYRILPKHFTTPTQLFIYGNKTGILIWSEEPLCILIENKEITKGFLEYFKLMWKISK